MEASFSLLNPTVLTLDTKTCFISGTIILKSSQIMVFQGAIFGDSPIQSTKTLRRKWLPLGLAL